MMGDAMPLVSSPDPCDVWVFFQERVNYYASELNIIGQHNRKQKRKDDLHLFGIEAYDKYDYHHNVYEPNVDREKKFWEPEKIKDYVKKM